MCPLLARRTPICLRLLVCSAVEGLLLELELLIEQTEVGVSAVNELHLASAVFPALYFRLA